MYRLVRRCQPLSLFVLCGFVLLLGACSSAPVLPNSDVAASALVEPGYGGKPGEVHGGVARFATIHEAVQAAPSTARTWSIWITPGNYVEKVVLDKKNVRLYATDPRKTTLSWNDYAGKKGPDGKPLGNLGSATLAIVAPGCRVENLGITNAFDYVGNLKKPTSDPSRVNSGTQATALAVDLEADRTAIINCRITGNQDTLFANAGSQYYANCTVTGSVDFIYGAAQAWFEDCDLVSLDRKGLVNSYNGYVTAPSTGIDKPYGYVFYNCRLKKEKPDMEPRSVQLGRPWHPGGSLNVNSSSIWINCYMDDHISANGYVPMGENNKEFYPQDNRFFEYGSTGPGAMDVQALRRQLKADETVKITPELVLSGWKPAQ